MRRELFEELYEPCFSKIDSPSDDSLARYRLKLKIYPETPKYFNGLDFTGKTLSNKFGSRCNHVNNEFNIICYIDSLYIRYDRIIHSEGKNKYIRLYYYCRQF